MDYLSKINQLQEHGEGYSIDYLPLQCLDERYDDLEVTNFENRLETFSEKIARIARTFMRRYGNRVFLHERSQDKCLSLCKEGADFIDQTIKSILEKEQTSLNIIFENTKDMLFSLDSFCQLNIYNPDEEQLELLEDLAAEENLYLKRI